MPKLLFEFKEEASDPVIDGGSFVWQYDSDDSRGSSFRETQTFRVGSLGTIKTFTNF